MAGAPPFGASLFLLVIVLVIARTRHAVVVPRGGIKAVRKLKSGHLVISLLVGSASISRGADSHGLKSRGFYNSFVTMTGAERPPFGAANQITHYAPELEIRPSYHVV